MQRYRVVPALRERLGDEGTEALTDMVHGSTEWRDEVPGRDPVEANALGGRYASCSERVTDGRSSLERSWRDGDAQYCKGASGTPAFLVESVV